MKIISIIIRKELYRFFSDKRLFFMTIILPGIMIYIIYSLIGVILKEKENNSNVALAYVINMPEIIKDSSQNLNIEYKYKSISEVEQLKKIVKDKNADLVICFPSDFEDKLNDFQKDQVIDIPEIEIWYNSTKKESENAYNKFVDMMNYLESNSINMFDINVSNNNYDLASKKEAAGKILSSILPMFILMSIFSTCTSIAPESISGEKERGTLTAVLIAPIKRSEIIIGKIIALSVLAVLSGISSFFGMLLSLPSVLEVNNSRNNKNFYGAEQYFELFIVVLSTIILIISFISVISTYAKNIKEANAYITPVMILVMVVSLANIFYEDKAGNIYLFLAPLFNSVKCMTYIFDYSVNIFQIIITLIVNALFSGIFIFILTRMFKNEKIICNN